MLPVSTILQPDENIVKLTIVIIINSNHLRTHKGHSISTTCKVTSNQILGSFIPLLITAVLFLLREKNIKTWTAFIDPLFLSDSMDPFMGQLVKSQHKFLAVNASSMCCQNERLKTAISNSNFKNGLYLKPHSYV